jgi:hypothetical protein
MNEEAMRICSMCDEVVSDPHVHNVWGFAHPLQVEQCSVAGLDLAPCHFAIVVYAGWVDMGMDYFYSSKPVRYPRVGMS